jgi:hypothetical protein
MVTLTSGHAQTTENKEVAGVLNTSCTESMGIDTAKDAGTKSAPIESSSKGRPKNNRGGKRPGAGRKPDLAKRLLKGVTRDTLHQALADVDVGTIVSGLLRSKREVVRIQTLNFVFDRILGKPKQDLSVSGGLVHAHVRDPFLSTLPSEALEELARSYDGIVTKYLPDAAAQDGPHNQTESKPDTIDAEVV